MQVPLRHWAIYIGRLSNTPTAAVEYRCLRAASESMGIPLPPPWVLLSIMLTFSKNIQDIKAIGSLGWSIVRGRGEVSLEASNQTLAQAIFRVHLAGCICLP